MKEFRSFTKDINKRFPTIKEFEREANRKDGRSTINKVENMYSSFDPEEKKRSRQDVIAENQMAYQRLIEKNERTKELIKLRDQKR